MAGAHHDPARQVRTLQQPPRARAPRAVTYLPCGCREHIHHVVKEPRIVVVTGGHRGHVALSLYAVVESKREQKLTAERKIGLFPGGSVG